MQVIEVQFVEHNKYGSLVFNYPGCNNAMPKKVDNPNIAVK